MNAIQIKGIPTTIKKLFTTHEHSMGGMTHERNLVDIHHTSYNMGVKARGKHLYIVVVHSCFLLIMIYFIQYYSIQWFIDSGSIYH